jgi:hypothetical protein
MESSVIAPFLSDDGHIVATCINSGYFDYLQNIHENLKRTNVPWKLCTVCMDAEAYHKCVDRGIPALELKENNVHYGDSEFHIYSSWNDANWNKITFMKLNAIQWLLSFSAVKSMTYTDSDIHVYRDYMPYLSSLMSGDSNTDLWIQSDHNSIKFEEYGWALCSGFFHLRNVPLIRRLFEYGEEEVQKYKFNSDQEHLAAQIRKYQVPFKQLDRALFPNGVFVDRIPSNAFLIHYNYLVGAEKKKKMAQNGHWYLSNLKLLRHQTKVVYPPFKQGLYLEEYFSRYNTVRNNRYMDVHWTNLQIEARFRQIQPVIQQIIDAGYPVDASKHRYFTVVQHDDGVMFRLPPGTRVYAAGGNRVSDAHIPIPLIYEDQQQRLIRTPRLAFDEKDILCSFVGSRTHPVRQQMHQILSNRAGFELHFTEQWTDAVSEEKQRRFVDITRRSKFCLAPRGYGRTSFRFYEALLLGTVPIYIWDDIEWLPYREHLDYSKFAISIRSSELETLESRLNAMDASQYEQMREAYQQVHRWFTMEGMTEYIISEETI